MEEERKANALSQALRGDLRDLCVADAFHCPASLEEHKKLLLFLSIGSFFLLLEEACSRSCSAIWLEHLPVTEKADGSSPFNSAILIEAPDPSGEGTGCGESQILVEKACGRNKGERCGIKRSMSPDSHECQALD